MYAKGTGGGKKIEDPLSSVEEDVLAIIKKVSVEGHDIPESTVTNFISNKQAAVTNVIHNEQAPITDDISNEQAPITNNITNDQAPNHIFEEMESQTTTDATTSINIWNETDSEMLSPVANLPQIPPQKKLENKSHEKNKLPKKLDNLINSAVAATNFESNLKQKIALKQEYYAEKLAILRRIADAEERKADSLQRIAIAIEANRGVNAELPSFFDL